jgi:hypothetical protein
VVKASLCISGIGWVDAEFVGLPRIGESIWYHKPSPKRYRVVDIAWSEGTDPHLYLDEIPALLPPYVP